MTLQDNAIQGNQRDHQGSMTSGREERKSNWQGWPARFAIGITLLLGGWWIAAQDFGLLYNLLIAVLLWWGASQIKAKSSDHEEVVWFWPAIVQGIAVLVVISSFLQMPITQSALSATERVTESTRPIHNPDTGAVQVMMDPQNGKPIRHLSPQGCASSDLGYCIDTETGERLLVYDAALSKRLQEQAMVRQGHGNRRPCTTILGRCADESIPHTREPTLLSSVTVPSCEVGWSETVAIPPKHLLYWGWQERIARVQYRGPSTGGWNDSVPADQKVTDVRFCVDHEKPGTFVYYGDEMGLQWERS